MVDTTVAARAAQAPGRLTGKKAQETRRRILSCVHEMLKTTSFRDLKITDVARTLGMSAGTFYHYFPDMETAVLALARQVGEDGAQRLRDLVNNHQWDRAHAQLSAEQLVDGFLEFWREHRWLLRVVDLATLEGDASFSDVRVGMLHQVTVALARVLDGQPQVGADAERSSTSMATAGVLVGMLAHNAAHYGGFRRWRINGADLREAMIQIVYAAVTRSTVSAPAAPRAR